MSKLRVIEHFQSVQGEGRYAGVPSYFVRLFGCNLRCRGFGMDYGLSSEYQFIDVDKYDKLCDVPVPKTGCDSFVSWDPRAKKFVKEWGRQDVYDNIRNSGMSYVVLTGGEPMLWQKQLVDLDFFNVRKQNVIKYTIETNGTVPITEKFAKMNLMGPGIHFSVSLKLMTSGEPKNKRLRPEAIESMIDYVRSKGGEMDFKFVYNDLQDVEEIKEILSMFDMPKESRVYIMPCGSDKRMYHEKGKQALEVCMKEGWWFTPRLQVEFFNNEWGT